MGSGGEWWGVKMFRVSVLTTGYEGEGEKKLINFPFNEFIGVLDHFIICFHLPW